MKPYFKNVTTTTSPMSDPQDIVYLKHSEESLQPAIFVSRIFGLAPFTFCKEGKITELKYSKRYGIYSALIVTVLATLTVFGAINDVLEDPDKTIRMVDKITTYITCVDIFGIVFSVLANTYAVVTKRKQFLAIVAYLNKIDLLVARRHDGTERMYYLKLICVTLTLPCTLYLVDGIIWYINSRDFARPFGMLRFAPFYVMYTFAIAFILHFWIIVDSMKRRIIYIREELDLLKKQILGGPPPYDYAPKLQNTCSDKITALISAYQSIFKAVHFANSTYGFPLAALFFNLLMHEVVCVYFWLVELLFKQHVDTILLNLAWMVGFALVLLFTVQGPEEIAVESTLISSRIAEMLSCRVGEDVRMELITFSWNLAQQPLKFSAVGLFYIDKTNITSMVSVITTYIVILMQFKISSESNH